VIAPNNKLKPVPAILAETAVIKKTASVGRSELTGVELLTYIMLKAGK